MIAPAYPGVAIGGGEQGLDLLAGKEAHQGAVEALVGDGEYSLDYVGVFGVAQRGVAEQRVDRGQPGVAGAHAVVPVALEILEESTDDASVEITISS